MAGSPWERVAPLTGIAFIVLFVGAAIVINNYDYLPPQDEIVSFYQDNSSRVFAGGYLGMVSAVFLIWFAGSLRDHLRRVEGARGRLAAVAFGGGVAAAAALIAAYSATVTAAQRAGTIGGIPPETATGLFDLSANLVGSGVPIALAVMLGAASVLAFREGALPRWLAWGGAVVALGCITPVGFIFLGFAAAWILIVSLLLYRSEATAPVDG